MTIIFCATKFEILGFLRKLKIIRQSAIGSSLFYFCLFENKTKVIIVISGIGKKAASTACRQFLAQISAKISSPDNTAGKNAESDYVSIFNNDKSSATNSDLCNEKYNIIVTGFAGSMKEDIRIGDLLIINEVLELKKNYKDNGSFYFVVSDRIKIKNVLQNKMFLKETGKDLLFDFKPDGIICTETICATVDEVINDNKQKLSAAYVSGANILDMETYTIIKNLKNLKNKSFLCIRVISDDKDSNLPDFINFFLNNDSSLKIKTSPSHYFFLYLKGLFKSLAILSLKPANIKVLFKFLKNVTLAEKTLSIAIEKLIKNGENYN